MTYILAISPILLIIGLMIFLSWGGQKAGPAGWAFGGLISILFFGMTPAVLLTAEIKGILLSIYVLMVLWPALLLYNTMQSIGGIQALAHGLKQIICDHQFLVIILAWAFSGLLEGLAGFGLPVAVVSPMLVAIGVPPIQSVAAVAIGHAWSVTFGDMGVIFQTLIGVSQMDGKQLVGPTAVILGIACFLCGISVWSLVAKIERKETGQSGQILARILFIAVLMAFTQFGLAIAGLSPIAGLGAGIIGVSGGILVGRGRASISWKEFIGPKELRIVLLTYGCLILLMTILAIPGPIRVFLERATWKPTFAAVSTLTSLGMPDGFTTPASNGQIFKVFLHPGTSILLIAGAAYFWLRRTWQGDAISFKNIFKSTWKSAAPASIGILFTVCLSTLMDHSGMTMLLAKGLAALMQGAYPIVSPVVGMLGAFATGSNNNSNVLFGPLQKNVAILLGLSQAWMLAAQTAGGSLGSMIAPAKIIVGCSTVGIKGKDGSVLKITLPYGIAIGIIIGIVTLIISHYSL